MGPRRGFSDIMIIITFVTQMSPREYKDVLRTTYALLTQVISFALLGDIDNSSKFI